MALFDKKENILPENAIATINLSRIEIPEMRESMGHKWVNYGADNKYPQYLMSLYKTSALHRTIIQNKSKLIAGKEVFVNDIPMIDWLATLTGPLSVRVQNLINHPKYPLRDWLKRTALDYVIFGAYTSEIIMSSDMEWVKVLKHLDCSKVRSGLLNKNGEVDKYFYSNDWNSLYNSKATQISAFNLDNDEDLNQLIYKRDYTPDLDYYTEPSYIGGLTYINLDSELGLFNLSHIENGMNPGLIFKVPYAFKTAEEKRVFIQMMMEHYKGARNNKNPLFLFKNGEAEWEIEKIDVPNFDAQLIALGDFILQQLIFAHQVTNGGLVGLLVPGKLGNSNAEELEFSSAKFNEFVIEPARLMLEETIQDVLRTHGLDVKIKIK